MKKKISIVVLVILLIAILLVPSKQYADDGGSVCYSALTYSVTKHHSLLDKHEYMVGYTVNVLGKEIFNNTHAIRE
ncbi:MAG: hypothetical protein IJ435_09885 [Clostridia bacterium]|nr:hypothetical protein [Clostridia bacterium]